MHNLFIFRYISDPVVPVAAAGEGQGPPLQLLPLPGLPARPLHHPLLLQPRGEAAPAPLPPHQGARPGEPGGNRKLNIFIFTNYFYLL